jgi:large subunit ribosomal protein L18
VKKIELQKKRRLRRKRIIRKNILGTATKPRLTVFRSNKYIYVQAIDDNTGSTIANASSLSVDKNMNLNIKTAENIGSVIGKKLKELNIETVVFDRNGYLYSGKVKALADGTRKAGIKF